MCAKVKARADQLVFEQGLTGSREQARRLIMAGKVAVAIGFVVLLAISLLNSRKEATKA